VTYNYKAIRHNDSLVSAESFDPEFITEGLVAGSTMLRG
jgi:hypothetical protein